ncbi:uncharacterized protein LOC133179392 [Saccostrea echinata]|uniref:uncharacterized protein LOC133179392 n=1 Tax=Saccostrea echinata TaxID=191078 RepID=UPI002A7F52F2|nr:uncharacterized protein LOC133179392 [Saccostrea echinata]
MIPRRISHAFLYSAVFVLFSLFLSIESETRGLHFLKNCGHYKIRDVSSELSYMVTWQGEKMPLSSCILGFSGPIGDTIYTRSVCYDTVSFQVKDCKVKLQFSEKDGTKAKNYSCAHKPRVWCAESNHIANINLIGADLNSSDTSSFKILVTAQKTNTLLYMKIGISVGLVCLCVTGILVAVCCFKKQQKVKKDSELDYTRLSE